MDAVTKAVKNIKKRRTEETTAQLEEIIEKIAECEEIREELYEEAARVSKKTVDELKSEFAKALEQGSLGGGKNNRADEA